MRQSLSPRSSPKPRATLSREPQEDELSVEHAPVLRRAKQVTDEVGLTEAGVQLRAPEGGRRPTDKLVSCNALLAGLPYPVADVHPDTLDVLLRETAAMHHDVAALLESIQDRLRPFEIP